MIKKLHHVSVAVKNLDEAVALFNRILNKEPVSVFSTGTSGTKIAQYQTGESMLEFMEPGPGSSLVNFIGEKGEGLHHIAFEVDEVEEELARQATMGVTLIDKAPRPSPMGEIAFTGPGGSAGVTMELVKPK